LAKGVAGVRPDQYLAVRAMIVRMKASMRGCIGVKRDVSRIEIVLAGRCRGRLSGRDST
jgi:hypothetical protein